MSQNQKHLSVELAIPATSANLGPGFDTLALSLGLHLRIKASSAPEFTLKATGRNADLCGLLDRNLMLSTYRALLQRERRPVTPLALAVNNGIPLGMGCGSSAAARVAGVALAAHFGELAWDKARIFEEAARLEGHPDNAASCVFGGFTVSGPKNQEHEPLGLGQEGREPQDWIATKVAPPQNWCAVLAVPERPLPTSSSRGVLPSQYSRLDAVRNLQAVGLLTAGFFAQNKDLVRSGMHDRLHEPYREKICPLLGALWPLSEAEDVIGVALSGAGPSVLLLTERASSEAVAERVRGAVKEQAEVLIVELDPKGMEARSILSVENE